MEQTFPKLQKGDLIAIVAPARPVDMQVLKCCIAAIEEKGYRVHLPSNVEERLGYLAGNDAVRAKAFVDAWCNPEVKVVWCYSGGYGCMRILDHLDYTLLAKFPKIFVGMSDITALHAAFQKKLNLSTFLAPNLTSLFGKPEEGKKAYAEEMIWKALSANDFGYYYPSEFFIKYGEVKIIAPGKARGKAVGGNLALLGSLIGTPYQVDTEGRVLFLEDVNEEPYRIDRMLQQLKLAGLLEKPKGVVLCSWESCVSKNPETSLSLQQVFTDYFSEAPYPVLSGFPCGHMEFQATVPLFREVELDAVVPRVVFL